MAREATGSLSHELRTPLNHIDGYAGLILEEEGVPEDLAAALHGTKARAQQALAAIALITSEDGTVSAGAVHALQATLSEIEALVTGVSAHLMSPFGEDLSRIGSACERLRTLTADLAAAHPPATAAEPEPPPEKVEVVLIVDDDEANRHFLRRRLERLRYRILEAGDGREALDVLGREEVDLVLLDIVMPLMDGFAVLQHRRDEAALRDIPFVVTSAVDEVESVVRCIELGAEDYLAKPFDPVILRARVTACLEKKRLHDREKHLLELVTGQAERLRELNNDLERRVTEKVREVERLSLMQRFLPPQLAEVITSGGAEMLKSHRREIAVLFCDLRGFTPFAETAEPEDVMSVLREMHEAVGPLVFECGGTLAAFTGDGMMVFFNDPIPCDDPAWQAVDLALRMQHRSLDLTAEWKRRGHSLQLGVGLAMGYATCGQIGFEGRFEYTAIGTVTNLAARLCGEARGGQVLANERIRTAVEGRVSIEHTGSLALKGFAQPVVAYSLSAIPA
jgi:class 3 adenylate cyclase/CheY-like chemotaxis protein